MGLYRDDKLIYVSKVGTGFDAKTLQFIWQKMQPLKRADSPFAEKSPSGRGNHWIEPQLVCEVRFSDWTDDGGIRHPAFLGLREDKKPQDCRKEEAAPLALPELPAVESVAVPAEKQLRLTNLKKLFWPKEKYTKGDLIEYYRVIAPLLLPYLKDRPLVLTRYPDGIEGKSFFQKDAPDFAPDWVKTVKIYSKDTARDINYIVVNDIETLLYVINMGTIPLHLWSSRLDSLERPDWLVLDLDPKGAPFTDVVAVARALHQILGRLRIECFIKTSGATGLHILVPLGARYTHEQAKNFARLLAMLGAEATREISTIARPLAARGGKVYIDFGQNGYGVTIAAPFTVRPLPGATVSCPLQWREVNERLHPSHFTIKTAPMRFKKIERSAGAGAAQIRRFGSGAKENRINDQNQSRRSLTSVVSNVEIERKPDNGLSAEKRRWHRARGVFQRRARRARMHLHSRSEGIRPIPDRGCHGSRRRSLLVCAADDVSRQLSRRSRLPGAGL